MPKLLLTLGLSLAVSLSAAANAAPIVYAGTANNLFGTLDLGTGTFTDLTSGPGVTYGDLTTQPTTGTLFATTAGGPTGVQLATIDPSNGTKLSIVGNFPNYLAGLKFGPDGTLYGYSGTALYTVNPGDASFTLIGSYGTSFDNYSGTFIGNTFYLEANTATGSVLYTVDLTSGAATRIGAIGYDVIGLYDAGGILYAFTYATPSEEIAIDPATGAGTAMLLTTSPSAIYTVTDIPSVPEPASLALIAPALGILLSRRRR